MSAEALVKVRQAITELVASGMLMAPAGEQLQSVLLQLLNECERRKQKSEGAIATLQQQISTTRGEVMAWSGMSSIVQELLNGHLERARTAAAEDAKVKAEAKAKADAEGGQPGMLSDREVAIRMQQAKSGLLTPQEEPVDPPKKRRRARN